MTVKILTDALGVRKKSSSISGIGKTIEKVSFSTDFAASENF